MCFGILALLVVGYSVSVVLRTSAQHWTWLDGWVVVGIEVALSVLCLSRGVTAKQHRGAPIFLGLGLLSWSIGDIILTIETLGGARAPSPSLADVFYLCFYPLAYVATVLLLRRTVGTLSKPNWLDGVVAGLGAAAVCAAFAFHSIVHLAGGGNVSAAVNLAYPIGDVLLLFLVVGGTALLSGARRMPWLLLAGGIGINVVGDTFNLFGSTAGSTTFGSDVNAIAWPVSILLMSMAVWVRSGNPDPLREPRTSGFLLPGVAAIGGLGLLFFGTQRAISQAALGLALATLLMVGLRLALSARDLRVLTEQRQRQALTDELTGLGNRRQLFQVLDAFFAQPLDMDERSRELAFLFVDLNHFKEINDSFGHPAGDELLRQVGPRLNDAVRAKDIVLRFGGDEFGVVLLGADASIAETVAQRIASGLDEPFAIHETHARIGVSIGIALAPFDATDAAGLLWCADVAMYRAKLGNVPFECYNHAIDGGENQIRLVDELRDAIESRSLVLHYQPQLDLKTSRIVAVEALVRWPHPRLGLVQPLKFIPLAEDAGLMGGLTALVLDMALAQCAAWWQDGRYLAVSVNISATNLLNNDFLGLVSGLLSQHGVPATALVLEMTETSIITDFEASQDVIAKLRDLGVVVSIDDFGAGYTSLAYLSNLAVRELKLDGTLITGLGSIRDDRDLELVRATIDLGHAMGLRVVAEGIEDDATLELLRELGCDLAQGYHISRPMPAGELAFRPTFEQVHAADHHD
jgi:diguanylate cyclase (GGDEF)-like protein